MLGTISWRGPFFGVVGADGDRAGRDRWSCCRRRPPPAHRESLSEPLKALRHRALATTSGVGLLYNWGFFTLLGYSPFLMHLDSPIKLGLVFCGWGVLVAIFAVLGRAAAEGPLRHRPHAVRQLRADGRRPRRDRHLARTDRAVVIVAVIVAGAFIGVNNTLVTTAVMSIAPVERPVASATYGFVRFIGGGLAPFAAGKLAERFTDSVPFFVGAGAMLVALAIFSTGRRMIDEADARMAADAAGQSRAERRALEGADGLEAFGGGETALDSTREPARS